MKYVDEYRDGALVRQLAAAVARRTTRPWTIMEICGGQTHAIVKFGLDELLPKAITLVHGPGCPVCVTPAEIIDDAVGLAVEQQAMVCSFGYYFFYLFANNSFVFTIFYVYSENT